MMRLSRLLEGLIAVPAQVDRELTGLCLDSRRARPGELFLACGGRRAHGLEHLDDALAKGVAAVLWEPVAPFEQLPPPLEARLRGIPAFAVPDLQQRIGALADRFFAAPSRDLHVVGVTGTDGKTSCSQFLAASLHRPDAPCGVLGTLGYGLYGALEPASHTTPDAIRVHGLLARMREQGARHAVMEVSSHALDQGRVAGVRFDTAVLTNLSRDHLDYHGDERAYAAAKQRLFRSPGLRHAVINLDDVFGRNLLALLDPGVQVVGYTLSADPAPVPAVRGRDLRLDETGLSMSVDSPWGSAPVRSSLLGRFNASNLLAVLAALVPAGVAFEDACARVSALETVPGRMERFGGTDGSPLVVVDYAHTPQALAHVLEALRPHTRGRLWCVFGCGGDRDPGKRPLMGAVAARSADRVVITDDNPRSEDPAAIVEDILGGIGDRAAVQVLRDRAEAIAFALEHAGGDDVVLVAGKGHEDYQEVAGRRLPFSDREQVRRRLEAREVRP